MSEIRIGKVTGKGSIVGDCGVVYINSSPGMADLVARLGAEIERHADEIPDREAAGDAYDDLTAEIQRPQPRRDRLDSALARIVTASGALTSLSALVQSIRSAIG